MNHSRSIPILVAAIAFGAMSDGASLGQEFTKGDEVIVLRVAPLQIEASRNRVCRSYDHTTERKQT
jgi:hypothetical protein